MNGPGKVLQQARKKKRYSIDKVHKTTKIKKEYLEGLENDNVSAFPAELYYKNFLKTYAQFLSLDSTEIINLYEQSKLEQQEDLFKQSNNNIENKFVEFYKKNKQIFVYIGYGLIGILLICIIVMFIPTKKVANPKPQKPVITKQEQKNIKDEPQKTIEQKLYIKAIADTWIKVIGDDKKLFGYNIFERIAKEGRKYGLLLDLITQRPTDLNENVISQCANFLIFKINHPADLEYIAKSVPNMSEDIVEKQKTLQAGSCVAFGRIFKIPMIAKMQKADPPPTSANCEVYKNWMVQLKQ